MKLKEWERVIFVSLFVQLIPLKPVRLHLSIVCPIHKYQTYHIPLNCGVICVWWPSSAISYCFKWDGRTHSP